MVKKLLFEAAFDAAKAAGQPPPRDREGEKKVAFHLALVADTPIREMVQHLQVAELGFEIIDPYAALKKAAEFRGRKLEQKTTPSWRWENVKAKTPAFIHNGRAYQVAASARKDERPDPSSPDPNNPEYISDNLYSCTVILEGMLGRGKFVDLARIMYCKLVEKNDQDNVAESVVGLIAEIAVPPTSPLDSSKLHPVQLGSPEAEELTLIFTNLTRTE